MTTTAQSRYRSRPLGAAEIILLSACIFLILYTAGITAHTYLPWGDEMQVVDPGASLYFGQGFTSSVYPFQRPDEFFLGNAPGFPLLLSLWFHLFGFGLLQARALSYFLSAMAMLFIWLALYRASPEMPSWLRLLACATAFMGAGITGNIWTARYDALGLFIMSAVWLTWTFGENRYTPYVLALLGACLSMAGFQWAFVAIVVSAPVKLLWKSKYSHQLRALWIGMGVGAIGWLVTLLLLGDPVKFMKITFGSQDSITGQVGQLLVQGDSSVIERFARWRETLMQDPSLLIMTAFALSMIFLLSRRQQSTGNNSKNLPILGVYLLVVVPIAVYLFHAYPIYYTSMSFIPAVIISAHVIATLQGSIRIGAYISFCLVAGVSSYFGIFSMAAERLSDTASFGYERFVSAVRNHIKVGEPVYADPRAYFAVRGTSSRVYSATYGNSSLVRGIPERDSIALMIVERRNVKGAVARLGGEWKVTSDLGKELQLGRDLDFVVARRQK